MKIRSTYLYIVLLLAVGIIVSSTTYAQIGAQFQIAYGGPGLDKGASVVATLDGGYASVGYTNSFGAGNLDIYVVKTDAFGAIEWSRTYGGSNLDDATTIRNTTDGGYIITGRTRSYSGSDNKAILIKLDSQGNIVWSKVYNTNGNFLFRGIRQTNDGGYVAVGQGDVGQGGKDIVIGRFDSQGNALWVKTYGNNKNEFSEYISTCPCGGFIVLGDRREYTPGSIESMLMKIDDSGNLIWAKSYAGASTDVGQSTPEIEICHTKDQGILVSGITNSFGSGGQDGLMYKTDSVGNLLWAKTYGGANNDGFFTVKQIESSSDVISCGFTNSYGSGLSDIFCVLVDSLGNPKRSQTYGTTGADQLANSDDVFQTLTDGGLIMSGFTNGFGSGAEDMYLVKTDAGGFSGCNETQLASISTTNPTLTVTVVSPVVGNVVLTPVPHSLSTSSAATVNSVACFTPGEIPYSDWSDAGSLTTVRRMHATALLPSGRVLVAGGHSSSGVLNSAEIYDPSQPYGQRWSPAASMPVGHRRHGIVLTQPSPHSGKVLVVGEDLPNKTAHLFDESTGPQGTWTSTGNVPAISRYSAGLVELPNGKVLYIGGYCGGLCATYSSAELYDPVTNSWSTTGSMATERLGFTANLLTAGPNAGKVMVTGGLIRASLLVHSSAELYDPTTETWSPMASMNTPRSRHAANVLPDGTVLVSGGFDGNQAPLATAEIYDPVNDTWTPTGSMNGARYLHTQTSIPDGRVMVAGGQLTPAATVVVETTEIYDHFSGTWELGFPMKSARSMHTATLLPTGEVLVTAGSAANNVSIASAELFDTPLDPPQFRQAQDGGMLAGGDTKISIQEGTKFTIAGDFAVGGVGGIFDNAGTIRLTGDYINEVSGNAYTTAPGSIELSGTTDQTIRGTQDATFNHLVLSGGGTKLTDNDLRIEESLDLGNERLDIGTNQVRINKTSVDAVVAGTGFINTTQGGTVIRVTTSTDSYSTPIATICDGFTQEVEPITVDVSPSDGSTREYELTSIDEEGISVSYDKNLTLGSEEETRYKVEFRGEETELRVRINSLGDIEAVDVRNIYEEFSTLDAGLYGITNGSNLTLSTCNGGLGEASSGSCSSGADNAKNWVLSKGFDEEGNLMGITKQYSDYLGKPTQSRVKNLTENEILATETIYDAFGRPVITTLPAPIGSDFCSQNIFITNSSGNQYSISDFDNPNFSTNVTSLTSGEVNLPEPVSQNDGQGTLGWYYSNNNTLEPYVATTDFPYSRMEYNDNNSGGGVKRVTLPGNSMEMGSGHEVISVSMPAFEELDHYLTWRPYFVSGAIGSSMFKKIIKTVTIDPDGNEGVTFSDQAGNILASCLSGQKDGVNVNSIPVTVEFGDKEYVDIHIAEGTEASYDALFQMLEMLSDFDFNTNVFDLISGQRFSYSFTGTVLPGFYRIVKATPGFWDISMQIDLNYHSFTYNYYDNAGRLVVTVPPASVNINSTAQPAMFSKYEYNTLGWMLSSIAPDEGLAEYVYRGDGSIRFSQNARQQAENKFSYTNYDRAGRPIEIGEYFSFQLSDAVPTTIPPNHPLFLKFQNHYSLPAISGPNSWSIFTLLEDPDGLDDSRCKKKTFTQYDLPDPGLGAVLASATLSANEYKQTYLLGRVSKLWNDVPYTNTTWYSYDEHGRVKWMLQDIQGLGVKTINYTYDRKGNVEEVAYQKEYSTESFYHGYSYDADNALVLLETSEDGMNWEEQAAYSYYLHGPLKRTELAKNLQGIDYTYTLTGNLKAINNPDLEGTGINGEVIDPGKDGYSGAHANFAKDVFGMALDYHEGDYIREGTFLNYGNTSGNNYFNGNIRSQRWKTKDQLSIIGAPPVGEQWMYEYQYDKQSQLKEANFGTYLPDREAVNVPITYPTASSPNASVFSTSDDYRVWGLDYDKNGNILSLNRNAAEWFNVDDGGLRTRDMDNLVYNYETSALTITNTVFTSGFVNVCTLTTSTAHGFSQGDEIVINGTVNYDGTHIVVLVPAPDAFVIAIGVGGVSGQTGTVTSTSSGPTTSNKLAYVDDNNDNTITNLHKDIKDQAVGNYTYNSIGQLIEDLVENSKYEYDIYGKVTRVSDLSNTTKVVYHYDEKGFLLKKVSVPLNKTTWYVRDGGGNVMSIYELLGTGTPQQTEVSVYGSGRIGIFNKVSSFYTYELTDHLSSVRATIETNKTFNLNLASSFEGGSTDDGYWVNDFVVEDGTARTGLKSGKLYSDVDLVVGPQTMGLSVEIPVTSGQIIDYSIYYYHNGTASELAVLEFELVDLSGNTLDNLGLTHSGGPGTWHLFSHSYSVTQNQPGMMLKISPRNHYVNPKWFDDVSISITPDGDGVGGFAEISPVSHTDYYPFGMIMPGRSLNMPFTGNSGYRYDFQGAYSEKDPVTGQNMFELRTWDGRLGRWQSIDPYGQYHSPYLGMGNNPISLVDLNGGCTPDKPCDGFDGPDALFWSIWPDPIMDAMGPVVTIEDDLPLTVFDNEPQSAVPIVGDAQRAYYWFQLGDVSRGMLYGAMGVSDVFLIKALIRGGAKLLFRTGVKKFTKSSLKLGQQMHKAYKAKDVLKGVRMKEFMLKSGKRVDFIDFEKKIIYELKPNNPRQIKAGTKQLEGYLKEVESLYGKGWKTVLDLY